MPIVLPDPARFFRNVEKSLRVWAGRRYAPSAKRWRNTRSGESTSPQLDPLTARFLIRFGIMDAGDDPAVRQAAFEGLLHAGARTLGDAPGVLAAQLHAFAAGEDGWSESPFCGEKPRCSVCPLCENCRYLALGARAERLSSTTLARRLATESEGKGGDPGAAELLALLLFGERKGAGAVARVQALLLEAGGLRELLQPARPHDGAGTLPPQPRARLRALRELLGHWSRERRPRGRIFGSAGDLHEHYHLRLRELKQECFCVACLDQKNRLLADEQISTGSLTEALVHPREVLSAAIRTRAAAIAVVHNHPSGDPAPSRADRQLTQRLKEAADLIGIRMLDHVIVGDGRYYSFAESGAL